MPNHQATNSPVPQDDADVDVSDFPQEVAAAWANVVLDLFHRGVRKSDGQDQGDKLASKLKKAG